VLAGGQELERALFYLDVEGIGVDMEEFRYSNPDWFREPILTNKRGALFLLDVEGMVYTWRSSGTANNIGSASKS
jgi:hypothetical protein